MNNIHLAINGQQSGPFEPETVKQMFDSGEADANTMGWMDGMDGWKPLSSNEFAFLGLQTAQPQGNLSPTPAQPSNSQSKKSNSENAHSTTTPGTFAIGSAISEAFQFFKANAIGSMGWLILAIFGPRKIIMMMIMGFLW